MFETELQNIFTNNAIIILMALSFFTAIISAIVGMIGGMIVVAVGSLFVPLDIWIPIHAVIQLASNSLRVYLSRKHIDRKVLGKFSFGNIFGTILGTYVVTFSGRTLMILIGNVFIFFSTWFKMINFNFRGGFQSLGFIMGFVSGIIGASGPLGMPTLIHRYGKNDYDKIIITNSAMMLIGHFLRFIAFVIWGFAYTTLIIPISLFVVCAFMGTLVGTKLRNNIKDKEKFTFYLKILLTGIVMINISKSIL